MENTGDLFSIEKLCEQYQADISFVHSLRDNGILEIITLEQEEFLDSEALSAAERFIRMHYDLSINMEGLLAVSQLLQKMQEMEKELQQLKNHLRLLDIDF